MVLVGKSTGGAQCFCYMLEFAATKLAKGSFFKAEQEWVRAPFAVAAVLNECFSRSALELL